MKQLLFVVMLGFSLTATAQKTDFSGTYKANISRTNLGPAPEWILPRFIKVDQQKKSIIISRTALNQELQEQTPVTDTVSFDGTVFTKMKADGGKTTSVLKWLNDQSFELKRESKSAADEVLGTVIETWSVEDGGKTLFVNRDVNQSNGAKYITKAYFDKQ